MKNGLVMIYTGNGTAKAAPALGQAFRALGRGWKVCIIRFAGEPEKFGGLLAADQYRNQVEIHAPCQGFSFRPDEAEIERSAAHKACELAGEKIRGGKHELVLLDGLIDLIAHHLLEEKDVTDLLASKPAGINVMISGGNAPESLLDLADLVTEIRDGHETTRASDPRSPAVEAGSD